MRAGVKLALLRIEFAVTARYVKKGRFKGTGTLLVALEWRLHYFL